MFKRVAEIMYFVPDRRAAAHWYAQLFSTAITVLDNPELFFRVDDQDEWFHQADRKVVVGVAGHVAYWQVDNFDAALERAISFGATLYRGPLDRLDGCSMCQVRDPVGNVMGLIGPQPSNER